MNAGGCLVLFAMSAFVGLAIQAGCERVKPGPERIYDTHMGAVACASFDCRYCGCFLWNCHDGHEYHCLQNVRQRDAK
jgi:hypothetical protein